jgi:tetratricopeptide (TPR) repeat protein
MKNLPVKLLSFSLLISFSSQTIGQNVTQLKEFAKLALNQGDTYKAHTYYQRIEFFNSNILDATDYLNWARATANLELVTDTEKKYLQAINKTPNFNEQYAIYTELILYLVSKGNTSKAELLLIGLNESAEISSENIKTKNLLLGIVNFSKNSFSESKEFFKLAEPTKNQAIDSLFTLNHKIIQRYKPKKAKTLNLILPGLGYWYSGSFTKGLNSLGLMGSLVAITFFYGKYVGFWDAGLALSSSLQRYYIGSAQKAQNLAENRKTTKSNKILWELIAITQ